MKDEASLIDRFLDRLQELKASFKGAKLMAVVLDVGQSLGLNGNRIMGLISRESDPLGETYETKQQQKLLEAVVERARVVFQALSFQKHVLGQKVSAVALNSASSAQNETSSEGSAGTRSHPGTSMGAYTEAQAFAANNEPVNNTGASGTKTNMKPKDKKADTKHDQEFMKGLKALKIKTAGQKPAAKPHDTHNTHNTADHRGASILEKDGPGPEDKVTAGKPDLKLVARLEQTRR